MPKSADETAETGNDLNEESEVIELTEEVPAADSVADDEKSSTEDDLDALTREMPEFRVPDDAETGGSPRDTLDDRNDEELGELRETDENAKAPKARKDADAGSEADAGVPSAAIFSGRAGASRKESTRDSPATVEDLQFGAEPANVDEAIELDEPISEEEEDAPSDPGATDDEEPFDLEDPIDEEPISEEHGEDAPAEETSEDSQLDEEPIELTEPIEEGGYDRQEMVKTIQMSAIDRREFERQVQAEEIGESVVLSSHSHAPDVLVVPPRVLTTRWKDGGPLLRAGIVEPPDKTSVEEVEAKPAAVVEQGDKHDADHTTEPIEEDGSADPNDTLEAPEQTLETPVSEEIPVADSDPSEEEIDDEDLPELEPDAVEFEIDSDAIEEAEVKPPPKPKAAPQQEPPPKAKSAPAKPKAAEAKAGKAPAAGSEDEELSGLVQELLDENKQAKAKKKPKKPSSPRDTWFKNVFTEEYLRTLPRGIHRQTRRDVDFIEESFELGDDDRILDLACGFGRHSIELTKRGHEVAGLDLSMPLLQKALNEAKKQSLSIKFIHGDMREMSFEAIFSACFLWQNSFGFFDDQTNFRVLRGIHRALRPGGKLLIDVINRDHIAPQMPHRLWWEGVDCVFLEEVDLDHRTSVLHTKRSFIYEDGTPPLEQNTYIRLYSLHELAQLLKAAGFVVREVSGEPHHRGYFLGPTSSRLIVLAQKRPPKGSRS